MGSGCDTSEVGGLGQVETLSDVPQLLSTSSSEATAVIGDHKLPKRLDGWSQTNFHSVLSLLNLQIRLAGRSRTTPVRCGGYTCKLRQHSMVFFEEHRPWNH